MAKKRYVAVKFDDGERVVAFENTQKTQRNHPDFKNVKAGLAVWLNESEVDENGTDLLN